MRRLYIRLSLFSGNGIEFFSCLTLTDLMDYEDALEEVLDEIREARKKNGEHV